MKHIQRHQQTRQQIEQQWMAEQAPEAVSASRAMLSGSVDHEHHPRRM
jgi:hypothetical protein